MNQLVKFGLILGVICLAATLVLAATYQVTKPKIEEMMKKEEDSALRVIMPGADSFSAKSGDGIEYFEASKAGVPIGYCIRTTASGYNGFIRIIVGIDMNGVVKGVRVLEHQETPGLGAKITEVRQGEKSPWFLRQFVGLDARTIELKKNVDAITGATISSAAVTDAVRDVVDKFMAGKQGA